MTDFILDQNTNDFRIENGDLVSGEATEQHQQDLIYSEKCWWKFAPIFGAALQRWINESISRVGLVAHIRKELARDGMVEGSVETKNGKIIINAAYPK